jgi:assimilatory nitrate reductase catalytic subunit
LTAARKGFTAAELLDARDRLTEPLVREHKGGPLLAVGWDQALDRIVAGLRAIRSASAPMRSAYSVAAGLTNEKVCMLGKVARVALQTANIDYNGRFCKAFAARRGGIG